MNKDMEKLSLIEKEILDTQDKLYRLQIQRNKIIREGLNNGSSTWQRGQAGFKKTTVMFEGKPYERPEESETSELGTLYK
jgi:hypothetical protein